MEQKLTAAIASMYPNAQVKYKTDIFNLHGLSFRFDLLTINNVLTELAVNARNCQLILTPISEISDADAVELCKITRWDYDSNPESEAHFDLTGLQDEIAQNGDWLFDLGFDKIQKTLDFLRSRGYDCGYGPIKSLINSGLAVKNV